MTHQVHWTLQGKGGVGKSVLSSFLTQYIRSKGETVTAFDTDPINSTLLAYKALKAERVVLIPDGSYEIDKRRFDPLMERILDGDESFVIDNGASSFIALSDYLIRNKALQLIEESGKEVYVHTVVTGGQAMMDTLRGFVSLATQLPKESKLVVWQNEYFGPIEAEVQGSTKSFHQLAAYVDNKDRVFGEVIIRTPGQHGDLFDVDLTAMLKDHLTFEEIQKSADWSFMAKRRVEIIRKDIFDQLSGWL